MYLFILQKVLKGYPKTYYHAFPVNTVTITMYYKTPLKHQYLVIKLTIVHVHKNKKTALLQNTHSNPRSPIERPLFLIIFFMPKDLYLKNYVVCTSNLGESGR